MSAQIHPVISVPNISDIIIVNLRTQRALAPLIRNLVTLCLKNAYSATPFRVRVMGMLFANLPQLERLCHSDIATPYKLLDVYYWLINILFSISLRF